MIDFKTDKTNRNILRIEVGFKILALKSQILKKQMAKVKTENITKQELP